ASAAIVTVASVATVTVASAVIAAPAVRAMMLKRRRRTRSKTNGRSWCTPSIFPPPQDLPVHGSERAEDRLQGFQAVDALRVRARQDRAEPHHGRLRQEAARTRARHQARTLPRPIALRHPVSGEHDAENRVPVFPRGKRGTRLRGHYAPLK